MEQFFKEVEYHIPTGHIVTFEKNTHGEFLGYGLTAPFEDKVGHGLICFAGAGIDKLWVC